MAYGRSKVRTDTTAGICWWILTCFSDVLVLDEPERGLWLEQAIEELRKTRGIDGIHLNGVHEESAIFDLVVSEVRTDRWNDFESLLQGRSKNFRKEIRSCRRRLESIGDVRELINDPDLTLQDVVEVTLAFKRDWVQDQGLRSKTILSQEGEAFLSDFCEELAMRNTRGKLLVNSVMANDCLVACGIAFEYFGQQLEYIGGFEHEQRGHGAGKVQITSSIAYAIERGSEASNFLTPATELKSRWTDHIPIVVWTFSLISWKGRIYRDVYLRQLRCRIKHLYHAAESMAEKWMG